MTTSAIVTIGTVAGIVAALLIVRYVESHSKVVKVSGFGLPLKPLKF